MVRRSVVKLFIRSNSSVFKLYIKMFVCFLLFFLTHAPQGRNTILWSKMKHFHLHVPSSPSSQAALLPSYQFKHACPDFPISLWNPTHGQRRWCWASSYISQMHQSNQHNNVYNPWTWYLNKQPPHLHIINNYSKQKSSHRTQWQRHYDYDKVMRKVFRCNMLWMLDAKCHTCCGCFDWVCCLS